MRLDHIAYRVADRDKTVKFFVDAFGYSIQEEFNLQFPDGSTARCIAMQPPRKVEGAPWAWCVLEKGNRTAQEYHVAPEVFVSDGPDGSIVGEWVKKRGGIGGIHHLAYQVDDVEAVMREWEEKGYAEFLSDDPLVCEEEDPDLKQVFTKPSELTGVIYEFITRGEYGFCRANVSKLMNSTKDYK